MSLRLRFIISAMLLVLAGIAPISLYAVNAVDRSIAVWHDAAVGEALQRSLIALDDPAARQQVRDALVRYKQLGALQRPLERTTLILGGTLAVMTLVLAAAMAWIMSVEFTRPMRSVAHAAQRIAQGDLTQSVPPSRIREVGALVDAFNDMVVGLRESREALARAERRAAWQDIARTIAHEIKNPLTPMRLTTQRLRARFVDNRGRFDESFMRSTEMILAEIDRIERMVNDFSGFAKMPAPVMAPLDLGDVLSRVADLFVAERERGRLRVTLPSGPVPTMGDRQQIEQAILNLVKNGLEAVAEAGGAVVASLEVRDDRATITVRDDGPGIASAVLDRIFQPYVTTKPGGSGIGLAVVERVVTDHWGKVEARNIEPHGAMFLVTLPIDRPAASAGFEPVAVSEDRHARADR